MKTVEYATPGTYETPLNKPVRPNKFHMKTISKLETELESRGTGIINPMTRVQSYHQADRSKDTTVSCVTTFGLPIIE